MSRLVCLCSVIRLFDKPQETDQASATRLVGLTLARRFNAGSRLLSTGSILEPVWSIFCPGAIGVAFMEDVKRRFRPFASFLVSAAIAGSAYGEVQCFGRAGIGW